MIYTSYFAKVNKLKKENLRLVSISRYFPKWLDKSDFAHLSFLAPNGQLLKDYKDKKIDEDGYKERYLKQLSDEIGFDSLVKYFKGLDAKSNDQGIDIVLCCYETSYKFCHRHILREFLQEYVKIEEL